MRDDPVANLRMAQRRYAEALVRRQAADPREPGYRDVVHDLGVRWAQVRMWQRRVGAQHRALER